MTDTVVVDTLAYRVTDWMPASAAPPTEGVYERRSPAGPFSCWNGKAWNRDARSPAAAAAQTKASRYAQAPWRGLVEPSAMPCTSCKGHTVVDHGVDDEGRDLIAECAECA